MFPEKAQVFERIDMAAFTDRDPIADHDILLRMRKGGRILASTPK
jgi:hypothetical protein